MKSPQRSETIPALCALALSVSFPSAAVAQSAKTSEDLLRQWANEAKPVDGAPATASSTAPKTRGFQPQPATSNRSVVRKTTKIDKECVKTYSQDPKFKSRGLTVDFGNDNQAYVGVEVDASSAVSFNNILFKIDSTQLADEASRQQVWAIADAIRQLPHANFLIEGHTCDLGSDWHNKRLSEWRADAIRSLLLQYGVKEWQVVTLGFGEYEPANPNADEYSRRLNRRVVIYKRK